MRLLEYIQNIRNIHSRDISDIFFVKVIIIHYLNYSKQVYFTEGIYCLHGKLTAV